MISRSVLVSGLDNIKYIKSITVLNNIKYIKSIIVLTSELFPLCELPAENFEAQQCEKVSGKRREQ